MPQGPIAVGVTPSFPLNATLDITSGTVVKATAGRISKISVVTASTAAGAVYDCAATASTAASNQIFAVPANAVAGTVYDMNGWHTSTGIVVSPGASGVLAICWS